MIIIDSNIWCYYFDSSCPEHGKVAAYIEGILGKEDVAMNTIIAMEISHYLIKNLGPIAGKEKIKKLLEFPFVIEDFGYHSLLESIDMLSVHSHTGIGGRDATLLAIMKSLGIKKLATHDAAFKRIDSIEVVDPA